MRRKENVNALRNSQVDDGYFNGNARQAGQKGRTLDGLGEEGGLRGWVIRIRLDDGVSGENDLIA